MYFAFVTDTLNRTRPYSCPHNEVQFGTTLKQSLVNYSFFCLLTFWCVQIQTHTQCGHPKTSRQLGESRLVINKSCRICHTLYNYSNYINKLWFLVWEDVSKQACKQAFGHKLKCGECRWAESDLCFWVCVFNNEDWTSAICRGGLFELERE